jgi:hypothetical protein
MVILQKELKWLLPPPNNAIGFLYSNAVSNGLLPFQCWNKRGCRVISQGPAAGPSQACLQAGRGLVSNVWFIAGRRLPTPAAGVQWVDTGEKTLCSEPCVCSLLGAQLSPCLPPQFFSPQGTVPLASTQPAPSFYLCSVRCLKQHMTHGRLSQDQQHQASLFKS